jgi:hypothetical protein
MTEDFLSDAIDNETDGSNRLSGPAVSPTIHICIRQTLDWQDEALVNERLIPAFRPKFDAWNATFTMPYHVFRARLKAIAELNVRQIESAICTPIDRVPRGEIIVPVDDDDWFAPDLAARILQAYDREASGYLWQRARLEREATLGGLRRGVWRIGRLLGRAEVELCKTNNYAVRNEPHLAPLALSHLHASAYFNAHPDDVRRIPATLAIQNRNLASQTTLAWNRPTIERRELVVLLEEHRAIYAAWKVSRELQWAAPYIALMIELMKDIDVR